MLFTCKSDNNSNVGSDAQTDDRISLSAEEFQNRNIVLGSIETKPFTEIVKLNGQIDVPPSNRAVISAVKGGYIKSSPPMIGSKVVKGEVLLRIENPEFIELQQAYLETFQELKYQKYEYERHSKMKKENVISEKRFLETENNYQTTKARYEGLKRQLELLNITTPTLEKGNIVATSNIYAPISGYVNKLEVSQGSYISAEKELLEIVNTDHIHLELQVYEKDILKIKPNQPITFKIPEASDTEFEAYVYLVNNTIEDNRTVRVHAHVKDETQPGLMVGMFVEAEVHIGEKTLTALPTEAIIDNNGITQILIMEERIGDQYFFKLIDVSIGKEQSGFTEIKDLTNAAYKENIVISGAASLLD
jgi:cobalt-zinc-cadmium efflux system membrane fusion protein